MSVFAQANDATGQTDDFFAYDATGQVYNGSAFVAWVDANYATYRIAATEAGTSGRYTATLPTGTVRYEVRRRGATLALSIVVWTDDEFAVLGLPAGASIAADIAGISTGDASISTKLDELKDITPNQDA